MENSVNELRWRGIWLSLAKHQPEYCWGPRNSSCAYGATWIPESSTAWWLNPADWYQLNIQIKTKSTNQVSVLSAPSKMWTRRPWRQCLYNIAWDLCIWPRLWKPFTLILEILPHSLELTWKLVNRGKCQVRPDSNTGRTQLPWGTRPPTKEAIAGVWRCQL